MERATYPSDLTDDQWAILDPLLPGAKPGGRPRSVDLREVLDGILTAHAGVPARHSHGACIGGVEGVITPALNQRLRDHR